MPTPIALCIEDLTSGNAGPAFMRCVAVAGRQPGLGLDAAGDIAWKDPARLACELWVSADDCLILYRPGGASPVAVHRAGRSLDVPFGKPVVVIDQDEVTVGGRRLRLHVHGVAPAVIAPSPLVQEPSLANRIARAAAVVAIGSAAATGCIDVRDKPPEPGPGEQSTNPPIEVRPQPPAPPPPPPKPKIEVRERPPEIMAVPDAPKAPEKKDSQEPGKKEESAAPPLGKPIEVRDKPPMR